jgi:hypothetical protein
MLGLKTRGHDWEWPKLTEEEYAEIERLEGWVEKDHNYGPVSSTGIWATRMVLHETTNPGIEWGYSVVPYPS